MQSRNLWLLLICQLISTSGSIVMVTLGGIIGSSLASNKAFSTLPLSMLVVAIALTTIPAAMLMKRIGRRAGFAMASVSAIIALLVAILALNNSSFLLFVVSAMLFGINMAFSQQYRYAAAESVDSQYVPRAISLVLVGSIGGALVGPELAMRGQFWFPEIEHSGTMAALMVMFAVQAVLFLFMGAARPEESKKSSHLSRSTASMIKQPMFIVAVLAGTAGYGLMTLIMTATPLSMHVGDGYSLQETTQVIRTHVLGMYVPSLFVGFLIERIGVHRIMLLGVLGLLATSMIGLQGHSFVHYWWALLLLGVGWNFLFIGGTTMLTYAYRANERFKAQAVNEFLVFGVSATASFLAGVIIHYYGWATLMWLPIPLLIAMAIAILRVRNDASLKSKGRPASV